MLYMDRIEPDQKPNQNVVKKLAAGAAFALMLTGATIGLDSRPKAADETTEQSAESLQAKTESSAQELVNRIVDFRQGLKAQDGVSVTEDRTVDGMYGPTSSLVMRRSVPSLLAADYGEFTVSVEGGVHEDGIDTEAVNSIFIAMDLWQEGEYHSKSGNLYSFQLVRVGGPDGHDWNMVEARADKGGERRVDYFVTGPMIQDGSSGQPQPNNVHPLTEQGLLEGVGQAETVLDWFEQGAPVNYPLRVASA